MAQPPNPHQLSIDEVFAARGVPLTRQRRAIWTYFSTAGRATTPSEAAENLRSQGIGQATVYRTVALLADLGLLVRLHLGGDTPCYAAPPVGHNHPLVCGTCRRIVNFDGEGDLRYLEKHLEATTGFAIYGHILEVYGVCPDCQASARGREQG